MTRSRPQPSRHEQRRKVLALMAKSQKPSKYRNRITVVDGIRFDSAKEARRWSELKMLEKAGRITGLQCHPKFKLTAHGTPICTYVADFSYYDDRGFFLVVEDVKSRVTRTPAYRLKKKLLQAEYEIQIREVE
jgi:hypothetical protein